MRLSLLGCKTARAGGRVKGGRSPFILTLDAVFCPCYLRGEGPAWKRPQGRAAAPERGRSVGIGELSPTSIFCEINRRGIEAKKQGVYHLALLATLVYILILV